MRKMLIVPIALLAAACSPPAAEDASKSGDAMNMEASTPDVAGPITSTGTVTQVDAAAGTIAYELFCALAARVPVEVRGGR